MTILTGRHLQDEENPMLQERADQSVHVKEAKVGEALSVAVNPESRVLLGEVITALANKIGITNEELVALQNIRDKTPAEPLSFD